jgi:hypothetical protein
LELPVPAEQVYRHADVTRINFHGFANTQPGLGHWNTIGYEVAGKLVAGYLCHKPGKTMRGSRWPGSPAFSLGRVSRQFDEQRPASRRRVVPS